MIDHKHYLPVNIIGKSAYNPRVGVAYNPHTPIAYNKASTVLITGSPGMGKTHHLQSLATFDTLLHKDVFIIDWKGDTASIATNPEVADNCNLMRLGAESDAGVLDPMYSTSNTGEKQNRVINVINLLLGGLSNEDETRIMPYISQTLKSIDIRPSMGSLVDLMKMAEEDKIRLLGERLEFISTTPVGRILFHRGNHVPNAMKVGRGTTIVTVMNLKLPDNEQQAKETQEGRIAMAVFYMITAHALEMLEQADPKEVIERSIYIDEAWAILGTPIGRSLIQRIALLGRSRTTSLILATQNYVHIKDADIDNTLNTHFAFGAKGKDATQAIVGLELPKRWRETITSLEPGMCIMKDYRGRVGIIKNCVTEYNPHWAEYFNTNPFEKSET